MAYSEPFIDGDGIHIPTYADILEHLIAGYKSIFGEDIYLGEDTMDYQMLSLFAKAQDDMLALVTQNYNARNPNYATGDALDLLIALNAMNRKKATASRATLSLTGRPYIVVPAGSEAIDQNGNIWATEIDCKLDANGEGTVDALCETLGAISANAGTIDTVYSAVTGWMGVTNADVAVLGQDVETDEELRVRRNRSVSMNTNGTYDALIRGIMALDDVEFVDVRVNDSNQTDSLGIPGHSICALVLGGDSDEIAEAIWLNKAPGVGTHGNTTKTYTDQSGNSNTIKFTIPDKEVVAVTVTITTYAGYDADRCVAMIKNSLIEDINALGVGSSWGVTKGYQDIYNAFSSETAPFVITGISATNVHGTSTTSMQCDYDEILYTDAEHITITAST